MVSASSSWPELLTALAFFLLHGLFASFFASLGIAAALRSFHLDLVDWTGLVVVAVLLSMCCLPLSLPTALTCYLAVAVSQLGRRVERFELPADSIEGDSFSLKTILVAMFVTAAFLAVARLIRQFSLPLLAFPIAEATFAVVAVRLILSRRSSRLRLDLPWLVALGLGLWLAYCLESRPLDYLMIIPACLAYAGGVLWFLGKLRAKGYRLTPDARTT